MTWMSLFLCSLMGVVLSTQTDSATPANVALNRAATQSSQRDYSGAAHNAVDGNRGSCSHTNDETAPWWRVDLRDVYRVTSVNVTNRRDDSESLKGAEICVGNSTENNGNNNPRCTVISHIPAGQTSTFKCNMEGRYVSVIIPGQNKVLSLCEVEVSGIPAVNRGLNGVATQSSTLRDYNAAKAIDGNRDTDYASKSCSETADPNPWWRVHLLDVYRVTAVSITNNEENPQWIHNSEIRIGNSLESTNNPRCAVIIGIEAGTHTFQCNNMEGRYVSVVNPNSKEILILCEVEVFGTHAVNVALKGVAVQSSLGYNGSAPKAIDGNRDPMNEGGSCSHTDNETNPWWRVDLLDVYRVTAVSITNRGGGDCYTERLKGAEVRIGNSLENNGNNNPRCAVISLIPAEQTYYTFQCNNMEGRYVSVVIPGRKEVLTLCEVEVFGTLLPVKPTSPPPPSVALKRQVVRVELKSDTPLDLNDPEMNARILEKIREQLRQQGRPEDIRLTWRTQADGKVFRQKEKDEPKKKTRKKRDEF